MSEIFGGLPIERLWRWILVEEGTDTLFGIPRALFYRPSADDPFELQYGDHRLETPIGVAAGPHTQLAVNIVSAWLTGARFIELKTVQVQDDIRVTKPCIETTDIGYNCEWSQELSLERSLDEYQNAWILLHLLRDRMGIAAGKTAGFVFNLSVGYDLEGIRSPKLRRFLDGMTDCRAARAEKIERLAVIDPRVRDVEIPDRIAAGLTVSTMHGCPPEEIERIGRYCIEELKFDTAVKLNPTLLGPEAVREILNDYLGFEVTVPDEAFEHDLKFDPAVRLIKVLTDSAARSGVRFGLKLTNTLETLNEGRLPTVERMHYLSGRALHPIAINLAAVLQRTFDGQLDISFAGGVDCFNIARVLACNLKPVTVCTDLLKPGGYGRLNQYLAEIRRAFQHTGARSLDAYIRATAGHDETETAGWINLERYADHVLLNGAYHRAAFPYAQAPKRGFLPPFDCIRAPCIAACPVEQEVPAYLRAVADGADVKAQQVILAQNPFPAVLGRVCHQPCISACLRRFIDSPPAIRAVKRFAADRTRGVDVTAPVSSDRLRVAIIGAGPAGLSAAYFLARRGVRVEIFEKRADAGGMAAVIPAFRLDADSLKLDIDRIRRMGVRLHFDTPVTPNRFEALRREFDCLFIAAGAQDSVRMGISGETGVGVHDHLRFLRRVRSGDIPELGRNVVVIGGGNAAIDVARTARRLVGDEGTVTLLYRRRRCDMPAEPGEVRDAEHEGVRIRELTMPDRIITLQGQVTGLFCHQLTPGPIDPSGRPAPVRKKELPFRLAADSIIPAIGQKADLDFFPENRLTVDLESGETQLKRVFAGGDIVRGAGTLVEAVADGRRIAENIIKCTINHTRKRPRSQPAIDRPADHLQRLAQRCFSPLDAEQATDTFPDFDLTEQTLDATAARAEAARCLSCDRYCAICTTVCPNRANVAYRVTPREIPVQRLKTEQGRIVVEQRGSRFLQQEQQIVHLVDLCNECGNCATFCPAGGRPWSDKPRFCLGQKAFEHADNAYQLEGRILTYQRAGGFAVMALFGETLRYETQVLGVTFDAGTLAVRSAVFKSRAADTHDLEEAMTMAILLTALQDHPVFSSGSTSETS